MKKEMLPSVGVLQLIGNQMGHPKRVPGCPGTERRYLVIPLGTVFNFRPRFRSTMSHSFFADGDGGGEDEVFGVLLLRAVESP